MTPRTDNERATIRDVMKLQQEMFKEIKLIYCELTNIKIKVAIISSGVATAVSVLTALLLKYFGA